MNNFENIFKDNPVFADLSIDVIGCTEISLSLSVSDITTEKNKFNVINVNQSRLDLTHRLEKMIGACVLFTFCGALLIYFFNALQ